MCEFSRVVELREAILNRRFEAKATSEELRALAQRFEVHRIDELEIEYFIIEKHDVDVNEKFDVVLLSEDMARNNYEELKEFDIEILGEDRKVNVGEIASQYLSLCIYM